MRRVERKGRKGKNDERCGVRRRGRKEHKEGGQEGEGVQIRRKEKEENVEGKDRVERFRANLRRKRWR